MTLAKLKLTCDCGSVATTDQRRRLVSTNGSGNTGPLGQPRGIGFGILLFIVTLGFYSYYWVYKTQEEVKQHTGDGLGGVLGLVVWIIIGAVSAFVIPSEIGRMYQRDGRQPPVTGWTGLWLFPGAILIIPAIVWFVKIQGALNTYWGAKASSGAPAAPAEA
jgi:Na+/proline symporter